MNSEKVQSAHDRWLERAAQPTKLLIIEDDALLLDLFSHVLLGFHCEPLMVRDGNAAMKVIKDMSIEFDKIILDYVIPGARAFDVMATITRLRPSVPTIIFSGHITTDTIIEVSALGLVGWAYKPSIGTQPALAQLLHLLGIKPKLYS